MNKKLKKKIEGRDGERKKKNGGGGVDSVRFFILTLSQ